METLMLFFQIFIILSTIEPDTHRSPFLSLIGRTARVRASTAVLPTVSSQRVYSWAADGQEYSLQSETDIQEVDYRVSRRKPTASAVE